MTEFNIKLVDNRIDERVKNYLEIYSDLGCTKVAGKLSVVRQVADTSPGILDGGKLYLDKSSDAYPDARVCCNTVKEKYPVDLVALFEDDSYLIIKGRTLFGAINEPSGYGLSRRIFRKIIRLFH